MTTSIAKFGFNSDINKTNNNQPATIVEFTNMPAKRKNKIVRGRVKIKLGKKKVVSVAPSSLIKHISANKLKTAARKVIRAQTVGLKRSRKNKSHKRGKRKNRGKKNKNSLTTFIV